jgi:protein-L-isoaspartate(D-aspartate) O-methyltransferase
MKTKLGDLEALRRYYAEELRTVSNLQSEALVRAFAKVPREHFLGSGPWQILNPSFESYRATPDADPRHLYHNVLVAIDASRHLNNGQPGFLAFLIDALELEEGEHVVHVGCGTGYYTAILAEVVGPNGHVTAIEIDPELATRARSNLSYLHHVEVIEADGGGYDPGPSDATLINAGSTHPRSVWLDTLRLGGRLLVLLTATKEANGPGWGYVLKVTRQSRGLAACFISDVGVFPCIGSRDTALNERLKEAFDRGDWKTVQSLRRDPHEPTDACWLHSVDFCLSTLALPE